MKEALLNPTQEAPICRAMIRDVEKQLEEMEFVLTHNVLTHEHYLQLIGKVIVAREIHQKMTQSYAREFQT